jgi:hypothetical protein
MSQDHIAARTEKARLIFCTSDIISGIKLGEEVR